MNLREWWETEPILYIICIYEPGHVYLAQVRYIIAALISVR